eukprot:TRINITY_DN1704_c0_g1_i1.p1 TRINITY_DN1704_c0_g1~~TRINITY_DN1704_c0_g1_i1.p1  ORF type:complete len:108 (-),score=8.42 TRINITY_DN1704_c0_g1_i1:535-858(-)
MKEFVWIDTDLSQIIMILSNKKNHIMVETKDKGFFKNFFTASVSSSLAQFIVSPFEYLKERNASKMTENLAFFKAFRMSYLDYFKKTLRYFPYQALNFSLYEFFKSS